MINRSQIPDKIPEGGHFVVVLKQVKLAGEFKIAATGIFILTQIIVVPTGGKSI
ncbi:hypothetical protein MTo_03618 [Microcystis aeruginosa NIES-1211]|jgi:hypothetical protein|uniref:Uncharacterized protein n=1 Tax=Microcystis aeruginosa NIES-2519 TaxID=2303981 RepID=A0A5A5R064_MICAE|nr:MULTISPECIES: hypothetical protein [Microcystis]CCI33760.1 hypothetical protein MICAI_440010 [Microcystis sp. T1-4]GBL16296.1 hypothetical protein MTo_03618 [Microcystis aeruginosa NIES-1211]GCA68763.1 hypothetical protein MiYa_00279 [Microcystis aeruginosa NIES-2519]GCA85445.1 hypothetical protein MiHa_03428 [Microcystis aeruginosa NIES-2522]GCA89225.1 hypothetical protein MiTa_02575 [Microcystis aeruginosa NIES-4264]